MTTPATLWKIGTHWAARFGCPVELLDGPAISAVSHAALNNWNGIYFFRHGASLILSVPPDLLASTRDAIEGQDEETIFTPAFAADLYGDRVDRIIGPAWLGYADRTDFRPADTTGVRPLDRPDRKALNRFAKLAGTEWADSGIDPDRPPIFGRFVDGELVAAGTLVPAGEGILNVGIITHPERRARGHGRAVVSALTAYGLDRGAIIQYRTLAANGPSLRVARILGFSPYGETIAIRLHDPDGVTDPDAVIDRPAQAQVHSGEAGG